MHFRYAIACLFAFGLLACKNNTTAQDANAAAAPSAPQPAATPESPGPPSAAELAGPPLNVSDITTLDFHSEAWNFGFNYDKARWAELPESQVSALGDFTNSYSKRTPSFKMVGGLVLKSNAGKALQFPVVTIGVEPLDRKAPSLESIRIQSGGRFLTEASLEAAWPAHLESAQFPRPLVDHRRQAFFATSMGTFPGEEAVQVMQSIFIRDDKFIFIQLTCLQSERQQYARDFGAMADNFREHLQEDKEGE
ncbi:MAG: hypothetical protein KDC66_07250 [Phaeodactylibacter sp.]|nr:hypothetical protein [Phaeodactylibacter sp.]